MSNSGLSFIMFFFFNARCKVRRHIFEKFNLRMQCHKWDAKQDACACVQRLHMHVYVEKQHDGMQKNKWELPPPSHFKLLILYSIHKTCGINLFTTAVKCSLFCTVLIFKHKQCIMGAGWVGDTSDRLQYVTHVIERVMGRQWMTGMVV